MIREKNYKLGDRFKWRLPKFIGKIDDMHDLFQAEDREFFMIDREINDFSLGMFVNSIAKTSKPNEYLSRLEKDYGLPSAGDVDKRLARLLVKMKGLGVTNEKALIDICRAFGYYAVYHPRYEEYGFTLDFYDPKALHFDVLNAIEEVKPAHLHMDLRVTNHADLIAETQRGDLTFPVFLCGEHVCGTIPDDRHMGRAFKTSIGFNTAINQGKEYYGYTNDGYRAGELRNDGSEEILYIQDFSRENAYEFKEEDE